MVAALGFNFMFICFTSLRPTRCGLAQIVGLPAVPLSRSEVEASKDWRGHFSALFPVRTLYPDRALLVFTHDGLGATERAAQQGAGDNRRWTFHFYS